MKRSSNAILNFGIMSILAIPVAIGLVYLVAALASTKITVLVLLSLVFVIPYFIANIIPVILPIMAFMMFLMGKKNREASIGIILCIIAFIAKIFISRYWI